MARLVQTVAGRDARGQIGSGRLVFRPGRRAYLDPDAGGLLSINYVSGEHVTGFTEGLFARISRADLPVGIGR